MLFFIPFTVTTVSQLLFATIPFILMFSTAFLFCCKKKPKQDNPPPPPKFLKGKLITKIIFLNSLIDWPSEKVRANETGYGTLSAIKPDKLFPEHGPGSKNDTSNNKPVVKSNYCI